MEISGSTSKYMFSSSPPARDENHDEDDVIATQQQKARLHEKFVRKLGRPDSFAELRRKNRIISEENGESGVGAEEEEEEEETPKPARGNKGASAKKSGSKLTPMEKQYLDIKRKHLDTVIVMEVGYKFKFFGEDARIASKELGIVCIPGKFRYDERKSA
jgi:DNA mismatch repair protein MSH3